MPVLMAWAKSNPRDFPNYTTGSWGPKAADELLARGARMETDRMRIMVMDVGGTHVKVLTTGHKQRVEFPFGPEMTEVLTISEIRYRDSSRRQLLADDHELVRIGELVLWD